MERRLTERRIENRRKNQVLIWSWNERRNGGFKQIFQPVMTNSPGRRIKERRKV